MVDLFEKEQLRKDIKEVFTKKKKEGSLKPCYLMVLLSTKTAFKELIKPKSDFRFFYSVILQYQPTCCSAIFFGFFKYLDELLPEEKLLTTLHST
jgi:hypothetical protein